MDRSQSSSLRINVPLFNEQTVHLDFNTLGGSAVELDANAGRCGFSETQRKTSNLPEHKEKDVPNDQLGTFEKLEEAMGNILPGNCEDQACDEAAEVTHLHEKTLLLGDLAENIKNGCVEGVQDALDKTIEESFPTKEVSRELENMPSEDVSDNNSDRLHKEIPPEENGLNVDGKHSDAPNTTDDETAELRLEEPEGAEPELEEDSSSEGKPEEQVCSHQFVSNLFLNNNKETGGEKGEEPVNLLNGHSIERRILETEKAVHEDSFADNDGRPDKKREEVVKQSVKDSFNDDDEEEKLVKDLKDKMVEDNSFERVEPETASKKTENAADQPPKTNQLTVTQKLDYLLLNGEEFQMAIGVANGEEPADASLRPERIESPNIADNLVLQEEESFPYSSFNVLSDGKISELVVMQTVDEILLNVEEKFTKEDGNSGQSEVKKETLVETSELLTDSEENALLEDESAQTDQLPITESLEKRLLLDEGETLSEMVQTDTAQPIEIELDKQVLLKEEIGLHPVILEMKQVIGEILLKFEKGTDHNETPVNINEEEAENINEELEAEISQELMSCDEDGSIFEEELLENEMTVGGFVGGDSLASESNLECVTSKEPGLETVFDSTTEDLEPDNITFCKTIADEMVNAAVGDFQAAKSSREPKGLASKEPMNVPSSAKESDIFTFCKITVDKMVSSLVSHFEAAKSNRNPETLTPNQPMDASECNQTEDSDSITFCKITVDEMITSVVSRFEAVKSNRNPETLTSNQPMDASECHRESESDIIKFCKTSVDGMVYAAVRHVEASKSNGENLISSEPMDVCDDLECNATEQFEPNEAVLFTNIANEMANAAVEHVQNKTSPENEQLVIKIARVTEEDLLDRAVSEKTPETMEYKTESVPSMEIAENIFNAVVDSICDEDEEFLLDEWEVVSETHLVVEEILADVLQRVVPDETVEESSASVAQAIFDEILEKCVAGCDDSNCASSHGSYQFDSDMVVSSSVDEDETERSKLSNEENILDILSSMADSLQLDKFVSPVKIKEIWTEEEFDIDELSEAQNSGQDSSSAIAAEILHEIIDQLFNDEAANKRKRRDSEDSDIPFAKRYDVSPQGVDSDAPLSRRLMDFDSDQDFSDGAGGFNDTDDESESDGSWLWPIIDDIITKVVVECDKDVIVDQLIEEMIDQVFKQESVVATDTSSNKSDDRPMPVILQTTTIPPEEFESIEETSSQPKRPQRKSRQRKDEPLVAFEPSALEIIIKEELPDCLEEEDEEDRKPILPTPEEIRQGRRKRTVSTSPQLEKKGMKRGRPKKTEGNTSLQTSARSRALATSKKLPPPVKRKPSPPPPKRKASSKRKSSPSPSSGKKKTHEFTSTSIKRKSSPVPPPAKRKSSPPPMRKKSPPPLTSKRKSSLTPPRSKKKPAKGELVLELDKMQVLFTQKPTGSRKSHHRSDPPTTTARKSTPKQPTARKSRQPSPPQVPPTARKSTSKMAVIMPMPRRRAAKRSPSPSPSPPPPPRRASRKWSPASSETPPPVKKMAVVVKTEPEEDDDCGLPQSEWKQLSSSRKPNIASRKIVAMKNVATKSTGKRAPMVAKKRGKPFFKSQYQLPIKPDTDEDESPPTSPVGRSKRPGTSQDFPSSKKRKPITVGITIFPCEVRLERMPIIDRLLPSKTPARETNICELCEPKRLFVSKQGLVDHLKAEHAGTFGATAAAPPAAAVGNWCPGCDKKYHSQNRLASHMKTCPAVEKLAAVSALRIGDLASRGVQITMTPAAVQTKTPKPPEASASKLPEAKMSKLPKSKASKPPEAKTLKPPEAKTPKPPKAKTSKPPEAKTSKPPEAKTSKPPELKTAKSEPFETMKKRLAAKKSQVEDALKHTCGVCGKKFTLLGEYETHLRMHWEQDSDPLNLDAEQDNVQFQSQMMPRGAGLKMKIRREKIEPPAPAASVFRCDVCGIPFQKMEALNLHKFVHKNPTIKEERVSPDLEILEEYLAPPPLTASTPPSTVPVTVPDPVVKATARKSTGGCISAQPSTSRAPTVPHRRKQFFAFHK